MTAPAPENAELQQAFALFSETSERLADAYSELQAQVGQLTRELAIANGELARRERLSALGEMSAQVAHQLRTPLATALLYAGHLTRPNLAEADRIRFADKTLGRLRYLERLIQDMLNFVKGARAANEPIDITALVDELTQHIEPQVAQRALRLDIDLTDAPRTLYGERPAILGALLNLMENALHASPPGGGVHLTASGAGSPFARFSVEDEGPGIAEDARPRLFEPFFTTREEGSGLGLAIVRQVADAHGGWVEYQPRASGGSCFVLSLPLQPPVADHV